MHTSTQSQRLLAPQVVRIVVVTALAIVWWLVVAGTLSSVALASSASDSCTACHTGVFDVGPVNRTTACVTCHSVFASHTTHNAGSDCGKCHKDGAGRSFGFRIPYQSTPQGVFNTAAGASADAASLHAIHLNATWLATWRNGRCASCHAAASCSACHSEPVAHGAHTGAVGATCTSVGCHEVSRTPAPVVKDAGIYLSNPVVNAAWGPFVMTGYWRTFAQSALYVGQVLHDTASAGASMQLSFTGSRVRVIGPKRLGYSGIADVYLDGTKIASITAYSVSEQFNQVLWDSGDIAQGPHTLRIAHSGTRLPGTTSNYFALDCMEVHTTPTEFSPECADCHDAGHLTLHDSLLAEGCDACHDPNLVTEHVTDRAYTCDTCHESTDPDVSGAIEAGDRTCDACHDMADHPYFASGHQASVAASPLSGTLVNQSGVPYTYWDGVVQTYSGQTCGQCHLMDLLDEHSKPSSSVSALSCAACHASPRDSFGDWNATCQQGGCHSTYHGQMATKHHWGWTGREASCGQASTSCHLGERDDDLAAVHNEAWRAGTVFADTSALTNGCRMCHTTNTRVPPTATSCQLCHPDRHWVATTP